jgi:ribosomal protein S18 acetylase RimI-like enzyme
MDGVIRPAVRADVPWLAGAMARLNAAGHEADARYVPAPDAAVVVRERAAAWFERFQPFPACFVAQGQTGLVGYVAGEPARIHPVLLLPLTAVISELWVEPAQRRHGLGKTLVEQFHTAASAAGYPRLEVSTLAGDVRAVAFWRSVGFADLRLVLDRL